MICLPTGFLVLVILSVSVLENSAQITSGFEEDNVTISLNTTGVELLENTEHDGEVVESNSNYPLADAVPEATRNIGFQENDGVTKGSVVNVDVVNESDDVGKLGSGSNHTSSQAEHVLEAHSKETIEVATKKPGNKSTTEKDLDESDKYFITDSSTNKSEIYSVTNKTSVNTEPMASEVQVDDFMKSRVAYHDSISADINETKNMSLQTYDFQSEVMKQQFLSTAEQLTMEETIGEIWKEIPSNEMHKPKLENSYSNFNHNSKNHLNIERPEAFKLTMDDFDQSTKTEEFSTIQELDNYSSYDTPKSLLTTETAVEQSTALVEENTFKSGNRSELNMSTVLQSNNRTDYLGQNVSEEFKSKKNTKTEMKQFSNLTYADVNHVVGNDPVAERFFAFGSDNLNKENTSNNKFEDHSDAHSKPTLSQPFRDYKDLSEEDFIEVQNLLPDNIGFKKEKIEPGVLFEECIDCDFRVLPIRPSEQRDVPKMEEEPLTSPTIRFPDLPEGRELQIYSLGLSEGSFLFGYLSEFLSWIQPNEFPVGKLSWNKKSA